MELFIFRRTHMRRTFLKVLIGSLSALAFNLSISTPTLAADQIKVVFHMADGIDQASRGLANIRNELRLEPNTHITVVALGDGIQFLLKGAKERNGKLFEPAVAALAEQGVEFRICNNTLTAHNVPLSDVLPQAKVVPAGVAEVVRLQAKEGYVYFRP
jgi:intracellular sulfur oxidation DsrE/DsrF family protein